MKPWERYSQPQGAPSPADGPWSRYGGSQAQPAVPKPSALARAGNAAGGAVAGAAQGLSFGFGDEIEAVASSLIPIDRMVRMDGKADIRFGDFKGNLAQIRERNAEQKAAAPKAHLAGELSGGIGAGGKKLAQMGVVKGGAIAGGAFGAGSAEDGIMDRLQSGAGGALFGAATGGLIGAAGRGLSNVLQRRAGEKAQNTLPSIDELRGARDSAYQRVDDLGAVYSPDQVASLRQGIADEIPASGFGGITSTTHPTTTTAMRQLGELPQDAPVSLTQLDNFRQLASSASVTNPKDGRLGGKIASNIDEFVGSVNPAAGGREAGEAITGARAAHQRLKQSELLHEMLYKASNRAGSTGSGANTQNAMRQNIRRILDDPKKRRGFSQEAIEQMERVVRGTPAMNATRLVGKAAPTGIVSLAGGGGIGGMVGGPLGAVAVPAVGMLAKKKSDDLAQSEIDRLIRMVRTGGEAKPKLDTRAARIAEDQRIQGLLNRLAIVAAN